MKLIKNIRKRTFPIWEVKKFRKDRKQGFVVKINLQYGMSEWLRMETKHIWIGIGERKIRFNSNYDLCNYDLVKVRIPALENKKEVKKQLRKERKQQYKQTKRW